MPFPQQPKTIEGIIDAAPNFIRYGITRYAYGVLVVWLLLSSPSIDVHEFRLRLFNERCRMWEALPSNVHESKPYGTDGMLVNEE